MKISTEEVGRIIQSGGLVRTSGRVKGYGRPTPPRDPSAATAVDISDKAQEVNRVAKQVAALPDVREEQVQALKAKVESGTYNVSSQDIADLMIRRTFADNMGE